MIPPAAFVLLAGCVSEIPAVETDEPVDDAPFEVLIDRIPGGVLLSGTSVGERLLLVGGPMDDGPGLVAWYDGTALCIEAEPSTRTLWWTEAVSETEWWAVGEAGLVVHEKDGVREESSLDAEVDLFGMWVDGTTIWAVGSSDFAGEIWRNDGGTWSLAKGDIAGPVFKAWDGWFVGDGSILRLVDGEIEDQSLWPPPRLITVRSRGEEEAWAVGGVGDATFLHWDGATWDFADVDRTCAPAPLNGVWTAPGESIWMAGNAGTMAAFDGETWTCPLVARTNNAFHSVWKHGDDVYFIGGNLFDQANWYGTLGRYGTAELGTEITTCE